MHEHSLYGCKLWTTYMTANYEEPVWTDISWRPPLPSCGKNVTIYTFAFRIHAGSWIGMLELKNNEKTWILILHWCQLLLNVWTNILWRSIAMLVYLIPQCVLVLLACSQPKVKPQILRQTENKPIISFVLPKLLIIWIQCQRQHCSNHCGPD